MADINKSRKKFWTPEITERINGVYEVETRFAIIMLINNFGSSNIKEISKKLGKNQATIHHHLQWLIDEIEGPALLTLDSEKSMKHRGKFYKLTEISKRAFSEPPTEILKTKMLPKFEEIIKMDDKDVNNVLINLMQQIGEIEGERIREKEERRLAYNHFIEQMMLSNLVSTYNAFKDGKSPKNQLYPFGSLSNIEISIKVGKTKHLFQVLKEIIELQLRLRKLESEFKEEMKNDEIKDEDQFYLRYHIFGGEMADFEFE